MRTYYTADYYVDWQLVYRNASKYERELALLSTLCNKPNKFNAAQELFEEYPKIIRALPQLIGCRAHITVMEDITDSRMVTYDFLDLGPQHAKAQAERYAHFLAESGLIDLLEHISSVPDYIIGVEVGLDSNGRKGRSGKCASNALLPAVQKALHSLPEIRVKREAKYSDLEKIGCYLPEDFKRQRWDWVFWTETFPKRFAVLEINHYGGTGSKPTAIVGEYTARQRLLESTGVSFLWVTDGMGWHDMLGALRDGFNQVHYMLTIQLAAMGQLEYVLEQTLLNETVRSGLEQDLMLV